MSSRSAVALIAIILGPPANMPTSEAPYTKTMFFEADQGRKDALQAYLLSEETIYKSERRLLVWLLDRHLPRKTTDSPLSIETVAIKCAAFLLYQGMQVLRQLPYLRMSKARATIMLVDEAILIVSADFALPDGAITSKEVIEARTSCRNRTVIGYVREQMPNGVMRIRRLAWTMEGKRVLVSTAPSAAVRRVTSSKA